MIWLEVRTMRFLATLSRETASGQASFFLRSPFRSRQFLAVFITFAAVIVAYVAILTVYWSRLPSGFPTLLFVIVVLGAVATVYRGLQRHTRIRELYLVGKIDEVDPESRLGVALKLRVKQSTMAFSIRVRQHWSCLSLLPISFIDVTCRNRRVARSFAARRERFSDLPHARC
jgi:hypothetical protein